MSNSTLLKEVFALFDRDGDGLIIGADVAFVIRATGVNPTDAQIAKLLDGAESEMFDYNRFEAVCNKLIEGRNPQDELKKAFKPFDRDGSGTLSSGELKHVMRNLKARLTDEQIDQLIAEADPSNSGKISYENLIQLLTT